MKKMLLLLFIVITSTGFAQVTASFGVRAGFSSAGMRGDAVNSLGNLLDFTNGMVTTNNRSGYFAGVYTSLPLGNIIAVEPGIYYSQKGYELNGALNVKGLEFLGANAKAQLQSSYIDVPVLLKANMGGFHVFAGPQVSYLTGANLKVTAGLLGFNLLNKTMDASNQFNRWDMGLLAGVGYQFANGLNITAAYDHGMQKTDAGKDLDAYNRSFKIGIGYIF
jgi:hypothetical protein